ncbi:MAG: hypothetical protein AM325_014760 [Candidatus Thorarchaeota archaeon SMTZ1-45]|nr:MAG: hypothetical protein AM325_16170 [Candidatus Thorarchaeota archaeon SMTZ1-45]
MSELVTLRTSFVAFLDGLWWGLRDNTGPLSMYEGYARGFHQMGLEAAEKSDGKGAKAAAKIAGKLFGAIGLAVDVDNNKVILKSCPVFDRILERGLEYSFHVEEICWMPMLKGIGEKVDAKPTMESDLRLIHLEHSKIDYKKNKAKGALEKGQISKNEYEKQIVMLDESIESLPTFGVYRFD